MLLDRTFHPDEANQAFTVGHLLETGHYAYRPTDHHGPTLYYAAVPLQKAFGHDATATLDGTLLRCTPLLFAVLALVFLFAALRRLLASAASPVLRRALPVLAVLLVGTAPMFVFFATDFIQEMLLVCFTAMMFWSGVGYFTPHGRLKPGSWALLFGISAGLAFATKETSVLSFAAAGLALLPLALKSFFGSRTSRSAEPSPSHVTDRTHLAFALIAFALTSVILFSSFCQDWQGVYNAFVAAPLSYFHRAAGDVVSEGAAWHVHPWWQHLQWLFLGNSPVPHASSGSGFSVDAAFANLHPLIHLLVLALPVALFQLHRRAGNPTSTILRAFLTSTLYTVLLLVFYSVIPYKTPWCTLQLLVPFLLSATLGYGVLFEAFHDLAHARGCSPRTATWTLTLLVLFVLPLVSLATEHVPGLLRINREPDSQKIPYNYAHASPEARQLAACVDAALSASRSTARNPFVAVALPPPDTWPFPWYNRAHESITGYWTKFEDLVELEKTGAKPTVVIVPMTQGHLVQPLFPHLKHTKRFYMRPGVRVRVFW